MRRTSPAPGFIINQIVEEPEPGSLLYAATDAGLFFQLTVPAPGKTWALRLPRGLIRECFRLPSIPGSPLLYSPAPGGTGIFRSTDRGANMAGGARIRRAGPSQERMFRQSPIDAGRPDRLVAAAGSRGVFLSEDGGRQWRSITEGSSTTGAAAMRLLLSPDDGERHPLRHGRGKPLSLADVPAAPGAPCGRQPRAAVCIHSRCTRQNPARSSRAQRKASSSRRTLENGGAWMTGCCPRHPSPWYRPSVTAELVCLRARDRTPPFSG